MGGGGGGGGGGEHNYGLCLASMYILAPKKIGGPVEVHAPICNQHIILADFQSQPCMN